MQKKTQEIINSLDSERVLKYYQDHSNKTTASYFGISTHVLKLILNSNGVKLHTRQENMSFDGSLGKIKGRKWVYNKTICKYAMVEADDIDNYLNSGWIKRSPAADKESPIKNRICVTDGKKRKYIDHNDLDEKLDEGFTKGQPHYTLSEESKESYKKKLYEHFGVINVFQLDKVKEKSKVTCLEKYGVEYTGQAETKKLKTKESFLRRTREEIDLANSKSRKTRLERYGDETYNNRDKARVTCLEKYNSLNVPRSWTGYFKDGVYFDSSWELALWIYANDMGLDIEREPVRFEYFVDGKKHYYVPDFLLSGELIDIKGSHLVDEDLNLVDPWHGDRVLKEKTLCQRSNNVKLWFWDDIKKYVSYVFDTYGKDYLKSFKKEMSSD